jgi:hypothetical protein
MVEGLNSAAMTGVNDRQVGMHNVNRVTWTKR